MIAKNELIFVILGEKKYYRKTEENYNKNEDIVRKNQ